MDMEEVKVVESSLVTPSEETPRKGLWLSPLDLMLANRGHTPTVYFYRSSVSTTNDFFDVARLKAAMAKALVAFYPLAGRIGVDDNGRVEINCGSQGALFVVAYSERTVDEFNKFLPSPELRRLFVPHIDSSCMDIVCAIQVTFLKCGGVALGTALHHVAVDAISAFHFFQTWSAFSRDGDRATVELPYHDRTLLRSRSPPSVHPGALSLFCPKLNLSEPSGNALSSKAFIISTDELAALKNACGGGSVSTFCALSSHVWQCMCAARQLQPNATTLLTFPANVRRTLRPPLPIGYFGNGIISLGAAAEVRDIVREDLTSIIGRIKGTISRMDDELVRSAIDYFELAERDSRPAQPSMPTNELRLTSWLGMPVYDTDFGWGKPLVMLRADLSERNGFVDLMDVGDGSVGMFVCMEAAILNEFQRMLYAKF